MIPFEEVPVPAPVPYEAQRGKNHRRCRIVSSLQPDFSPLKETRMNRFSLTLLCLSLSAVSAQAGVIAMPPPGPARIAKADAVIVGKVEAIEPMDIKAGNANYRIAVVRITDGLRGVKDEKTLRIGFIPIEKPKPNVFISGARPVQLAAGQEGLFILKKQPQEKFY